MNNISIIDNPFLLPIGTGLVCERCKFMEIIENSSEIPSFYSKELFVAAIFLYGLFSKKIIKTIIGK